MDYTLTVLDTAGIQSYIFNSNELRENIGASHLVYLATTIWVEDALNSLQITHNYQVQAEENNPYKDKNSYRLENMGSEKRAELLYAGGGNTFLLFGGDGHLATAKAFVHTLSKRVIEEAPGLNLYATHVSYQWGDNLPKAVKTAVKQLEQIKNSLPVYQPTQGLSITAACASTGLPANGAHPDPDKNGHFTGQATLANRANRQVMAQWHAARHDDENKDTDATGRLRKMFPFVKNRYEWTDNLDNIGKLPERDESFIAVVHADGNGMGKRMLNLSQFFDVDYPQEPRAYISAVRELSLAYQHTAQEAFCHTVYDLYYSLEKHEFDNHDEDADLKRYYGVVEEKRNGRKEWVHYFPFRPVVFGGDDVTWVCAGPWGVPMAQRYLAYLEQRSLPSSTELLACSDLSDSHKQSISRELDAKLKLPMPPYACAGISIVKTHYPISRAHDNSSQLASSAKKQVLLYRPDKDASAIDWHFTMTGLAGTLAQIRQREYETTEPEKIQEEITKQAHYHQLTMRPLMLDTSHTWRNWENFYSVYEQFKRHRWFNARNKLMALREALHEGPTAVSEFKETERLGAALPHVPSQANKPATKLEHGWMNWQKSDISRINSLPEKDNKVNRDQARELAEIGCAYFDAIEMEGQFLKLFEAPIAEKEAACRKDTK